MPLPVLGFALYFAPLAAVMLALDRMTERRTRHKIAAACAGIAILLPPACLLQPNRIYGFYALVALLVATALCLGWRPPRPDVGGGFALRVLSVVACAIYLFAFCNMGSIDMKTSGGR